MAGDDLPEFWSHCRKRVDDLLEHFLPSPQQEPEWLHAAMRYSSIGAGKRYRAALVYATGDSLGAEESAMDRAACAVELIHAFSLVHDDLPAMDDDDLRRGKASCHVAFDEPTAILAGDALQTLAFGVLCGASDTQVSQSQTLKMVESLASASGSLGLAGGQAIDLSVVAKDADRFLLERMHHLKTGALIRASVDLGALCADADSNMRECLARFSAPMGLAFQIVDDILDGTADTQTLGKPAGADREKDKPTFLSVLGEGPSKAYAEELTQQALGALDDAGLDARLLRSLALFTLQRSH
ncbi:MAG: polyprenyl synthetase family protein [Arenicellales bacterium]